jgi:FtsP/CotA-like multicopper oxidase with cupredoxin domain
MGLAERADVIVDFTGLPTGTIVRMINTGPDAPFGGFPIDEEEEEKLVEPADPVTTGQVMQFVVNTALNGASPTDPGGATPATAPGSLVLSEDPGGDEKLGDPDKIRDLALLEEESALVCATADPAGNIVRVAGTPPACPEGSEPFAPKAAVLGTMIDPVANIAASQMWHNPIRQNPQLNAVETWALWNNSEDAHPIHLHMVKFEVVNRQVIGSSDAPRPAEPTEAGWKDTVIAYPGEITRVRAKFDIPGLYVWHCHILSHEDNEMMVPYYVCRPGVDCPADLFPQP